MAAKLFLIVGLAVSGFIWLLAAQMRFMVMRVLELNAAEQFPDISSKEQKSVAKSAASGHSGARSEALQALCSKAIGHYRLARKAGFVAPFLGLFVVLFWRFALGGAE